MLGEVIDVARHLGRQLAGRGQDQHPGVGRLHRRRIVHQPLQDGQGKGGGLAGTGLRWPARHDRGEWPDRLLLHRVIS